MEDGILNSESTEQALTLYELNSLVAEVINNALPHDFWVQAELSEIREVRGHCYMNLVQKDEHGNTPIATASAKCWASTWASLKKKFIRKIGQPPRPGINVLISVRAQFHPAYGFSWIVSDIDPTYTIGDMARKRKEIIEKLRKTGIIDMNKQLAIPPFVRRVAVISAPTAAGYGDFNNQLKDNEYGYVFTVSLFPATMQGEGVEKSVMAALNDVMKSGEPYDVAVIIRGGGATSDMSGFDSLPLAEFTARFPIPVIVGIGHDRDECVLDVVAHTSVKTPTAAAALLVSILKTTEDSIDDAAARIYHSVDARMKEEQKRIGLMASRIPLLFSMVKTKQIAVLDTLWNRLSTTVMRRLDKEKHTIALLVQRADALDPTLLLKRGYSITMHDGKTVCDPSTLNVGDEIITRVEKGIIKSTVNTNQNL